MAAPMKLTIFTDGASRGNPGHASYGFVIEDEGKKILFEQGEYIGVTTNNVAEYTAVLEALKFVKNKYGSNLTIKLLADSKLVVEQLSGRYKIKSSHLRLLIDQINLLTFNFKAVTFKHLPRSQNFLADSLANQALDNRV